MKKHFKIIQIKDDCVLSIDKPISSSIDIKVHLESNELKFFYVYSNDKIKKIKKQNTRWIKISNKSTISYL